MFRVSGFRGLGFRTTVVPGFVLQASRFLGLRAFVPHSPVAILRYVLVRPVAHLLTLLFSLVKDIAIAPICDMQAMYRHQAWLCLDTTIAAAAAVLASLTP